jgi:hypothetical protein
LRSAASGSCAIEVERDAFSQRRLTVSGRGCPGGFSSRRPRAGV